MREQVHGARDGPQSPPRAEGSLREAKWNPRVLGAVIQEREGGGLKESQWAKQQRCAMV